MQSLALCGWAGPSELGLLWPGGGGGGVGGDSFLDDLLEINVLTIYVDSYVFF